MTEYVDVTVKLPKGLLAFLNDVKGVLDGSVEDYLQYSVIDSVSAHIESGFFAPDKAEVIKRYSLEGVLSS